MTQPKLIQTFLPDGTLEGVKIIEVSDSQIKAFVIPRLHLNNVKNRSELLRPALYFLLSADESSGYIGESENFYHRIKNHDQNKDFWDIAVAIVSTTNNLEKSDVKYLESLAVERAQAGTVQIQNKTVPVKNNIHEFKLHIIEKILDDAGLILTSLGYDILRNSSKQEEVWYCTSKKTVASAQFRGDKFIMLQGSVIDKTSAPTWNERWPKALAEREEIFSKYGKDEGQTIRLLENVAFKSPNQAGGFATGHSINAWILWKDSNGKTMDEVIRKS